MVYVFTRLYTMVREMVEHLLLAGWEKGIHIKSLQL